MATDISCTIPRPDITALHSKFTTELSSRLLGGAPVIPNSAEDILSFVMAGATNLAWSYVNQALREADPSTMCCDNLIVYAARHGFELRSSTRAKGYIILGGTPGAVIPATIRFIGPNGIEYKLDPAITTNPSIISADGTASLRVVSAGAGTAWNVAPGVTVTVGSTSPGINSTGVVADGGIGGGADAESCDQLRARVVAAESRGVVATNIDWYLTQGERYPGVVKVCQDKCVSCCDPSTVSLYPFFGDTYPPYGVPPGEVIEQMNQWMFGSRPGMGEGLAPVGMTGSFRCALPTVMDITLHCFKGCGTGIIEAVQENVQNWINNNYCVGDVVCKSHLIAAVNAAAGTDACFASAELIFDGSQWAEDAANVYLDCGHFLVINEVTIEEVTPLRRPTLISLAPATAIIGDDPLNVTLTGADFVPSSIVTAGSAVVPVTYVSPTQLVITIDPSNYNTPQQLPIVVRNGTLTSATIYFTLNEAPLALTKLTPAAAYLPASQFLLTVDGAGFSPTSVILFDGVERATTYVSQGRLQTTILDASNYLTPGDIPVVIRRGIQLSNTLHFEFVALAPITMVSVTPNTALITDVAVPVDVVGTNFDSTCTIYFNGAQLTTTYISDTSLQATINPSTVLAPGDYVVYVGRGLDGASSNSLPFTVEPEPEPEPEE